MFLLDSNVISELRSPNRCDPKVRAWEQGVPLVDCWLSVITLMEIRQGIDRLKSRDPSFAAALEEWLEKRVKPAFDGRILAVTAAVANAAGRIAAERTRGLADCLIAATALEHGLKLVTRNETDFADVRGLGIVNPWSG